MNDYTQPERSHAILLTIDAQRDYARSGSPVCTATCVRAAPHMGRLAQGFREHGLPIVHMVRLYRPDGSNVDLCRRTDVEEGLRVLMPGTQGAELIGEMQPASGERLDPQLLMDGATQEIGPREWAMYKPRWGAFYGTSLERHLRWLGVNTVVVCGCNFMSSLRATILEASERDLRVVLLTDAVGGASEDGLQELARLGVHLMTTEHCLSWLAGEKHHGCAA
jgi:nicotinamidase-related amidase